MRPLALTIFVQIAVMATASTVGYSASSGAARITYIASEGIYLDAGRAAGIHVGDTLEVMRKTNLLGKVVITSLSSRSAAATAIPRTKPLKVGDIVLLPKSKSDTVETVVADIPQSAALSRKPRSETTRAADRITGRFTVGQQWRHDMTGSSLNSFQPYLRTKITVRDVIRPGINFNIKQRVRLSHRSRSYGSAKANEWSNQVYEFSLTGGGRQSDREARWGIGRVLVNEVRGMGYLDGGYYVTPVSPTVKAGFAIGTVPDSRSSDIQSSRGKLGFVVEHNIDRDTGWRLTSSVALSGEYEKDTLSREFVYVQTNYSRGSWLTWFQSAEIDYNRSWRYYRTGSRLKLSSYYSTANIVANPSISFNVSFDTRTNLLTYDSKALADSLFNDQRHQGLRAGVRLRPHKRITVSANASLRFREGLPANNKMLWFMARVNQFPARRQSLSLRFSTLKTEFTTVRRPAMMFRFSVARQVYINTSITAYIYEIGDRTTKNYYFDANTSFLFGRRFTFYGGIRQYIDSQLKSLEVFTEFGYALGK